MVLFSVVDNVVNILLLSQPGSSVGDTFAGMLLGKARLSWRRPNLPARSLCGSFMQTWGSIDPDRGCGFGAGNFHLMIL